MPEAWPPPHCVEYRRVLNISHRIVFADRHRLRKSAFGPSPAKGLSRHQHPRPKHAKQAQNASEFSTGEIQLYLLVTPLEGTSSARFPGRYKDAGHLVSSDMAIGIWPCDQNLMRWTYKASYPAKAGSCNSSTTLPINARVSSSFQPAFPKALMDRLSSADAPTSWLERSRRTSGVWV